MRSTCADFRWAACILTETERDVWRYRHLQQPVFCFEGRRRRECSSYVEWNRMAEIFLFNLTLAVDTHYNFQFIFKKWGKLDYPIKFSTNSETLQRFYKQDSTKFWLLKETKYRQPPRSAALISPNLSRDTFHHRYVGNARNLYSLRSRSTTLPNFLFNRQISQMAIGQLRHRWALSQSASQGTTSRTGYGNLVNANKSSPSDILW